MTPTPNSTSNERFRLSVEWRADRRCLAVAIVLSSSVAAPALAASDAASQSSATATTQQTERAAERYQAGVQAYSAGRYKDAIDCFREADAIKQSPALSFNTALAYDKLLDTAGALAHYREYLRRDPRAPRGPEIRERIRELEALLASRGVQQVTVQSEPAGATVVIDDAPVGVTPWTGELKPGAHSLVLRSPGYFDSTQRLNLALDHAVAFDFRLNRSPESVERTADAGATTTASSKDSQAGSGMSSIWPWVAFGGSAASLLMAGTFEVLREGAEGKAKSQTIQLEYDRALRDAKGHQTSARIFAGLGGGLAVTGVVLLVVRRPKASERRSTDTAFACDGAGCYGSVTTVF